MKLWEFVLAALVLTSWLCGEPAVCKAEGESLPEHRDLFEQSIRPILVKHCIECHGDSKQEGGLQLTTLQGLVAGGESGPAIVPGDAQASILLEAVRYESYEMPPAGPLGDEVADAFETWITAGANWPRGVELQTSSGLTPEDQNWWCYQPLASPEIPKLEDASWCRNEIDHFVLHRLRQNGLTPSGQSQPTQLVRRLHHDVTGLPPGERDALAIESGKDWYPAMVDRLLADEGYGQQQARYWLDLVRYADSDGYNADHARPEAHHYRDYVIRSFNEDKAYDRFVAEQLAGDELDPGNREALVATMYLRHWIYEHNQRDVEGQWRAILDDVTETTADVFLAQGLKCARCHDHKFDPLLQRDYFALKAFFTPLLPREDQPIADVETRRRYERQLKDWEAQTESIRHRLHEIETPALLAHATGEGVFRFTQEIQENVHKRADQRSPYEHQIGTLASYQFQTDETKLPEWLDAEAERERQDLREQLGEFDALKPDPLPTLKFVASDVGPVAPPTTIPDQKNAKDIPPGFPTVIDDQPALIEPPDDALQSTGRRSALARWIAEPSNPLTARVMVNRVWQQHFGRGLAVNPSDFGRLGSPPSHPELLDWLATRFVADGWSLKKLHRLILHSATYRQSSIRPMDADIAAIDPENVWLWRMSPRRLSGEEIHDAILAACDELTTGNRAIHKTVKRNKLDPLLAAFDFPDRVQSQCERHRTTTSPQALMLMNDPWVYEHAQTLAVVCESDDLDALVTNVFRRLYFRNPSANELLSAQRFVDTHDDDANSTVALLHAYLCSNEMIYVD